MEVFEAFEKVANAGSLSDAKTALKRIDLATELSELTEVFRSDGFELSESPDGQRHFVVDDTHVPLDDVIAHMRLGELNEVLKAFGKDYLDTSVAEAFRKQVKQLLPDITIREYQDQIKRIADEHPDLGKTYASIADVPDETVAKVNVVLAEYAKKADSKLHGHKGLLVTAAATITFAVLYRKMKEMPGVYKVKRVNGINQTCRLSNHFCGSQATTPSTLCTEAGLQRVPMNVNVLMADVLQNASHPKRAALSTVLEVTTWDQTAVTAALADPEKVAKIQSFIDKLPEKQRVVPSTACGAAGRRSGCINFKRWAKTTSVDYLDTRYLETNETILCVPSATLASALGELVAGTTKDILDPINNAIFGGTSGWWWGIGGLTLIVVIILAIFRMSSASRQDQSASPPPSVNVNLRSAMLDDRRRVARRQPV